MQHGRNRFIVLFLAAPLLLFGTFVLWPYLQGVIVSFTDWSGFSGERNFVGLANYAALIRDNRFWQALLHNFIYLLVLPPITIGLALLFASITSIMGGRNGRIGPVKGASWYRAILFFPNVLPAVMAMVLWQFIFNPRIGILNGLLSAVGLGDFTRTWLGDPGTARWAVLAVLVWGQTGFYYVLFSAAFGSIPKEYFEAAQLDGVGRWGMFWKIALPMIFDTTQVAFINLGMFALDMFVTVAILTPDGGPNGTTEVISTYMQRTAFAQGRFGYAAAMGVVMAIITLIFAALTFRITRRERLEY